MSIYNHSSLKTVSRIILIQVETNMWAVLAIILLALAYYFLGIKPYKYWKGKGVPYIKPYPLIGNLQGLVFRMRSIHEMADDLYWSFPNNRYVGFYEFIKPAFVVRDPELIKRIAVKEFDSFPDHRNIVTPEADPLWNKHLFALKRARGWHDMRAILSPSFTSNKMKIMFGLMKDCTKNFVDYFEKQEAISEIDMTDAFSRYTSDIIASVAFGITCNSLKDRNNVFYLMGKDLGKLDDLRAAKAFFISLSPTLVKILGLTFLPKSVTTFFRGIIKETLTLRKDKGIIRPDMIYLLLEARKGRLKNEEANYIPDLGFAVAQESSIFNNTPKIQKPEISDEDITANAISFFLAGFETTSSFISFTAYELALNPDVQQRLYEEIVECYDGSNEDFTYEAILEMKYLDMVVSESLRKWPPDPIKDRMSVKPFTIEPEVPNEGLVVLDSGINIWIPINGIHRDPKYYPNPDKFDPERFSDGNKHKIKPYTYMPFGIGPRNCIGSRFALLQGKLVIAELLRKFEIIPVEKTPIPLKFKKGAVIPIPEKRVWLGLKLRET